MKARENLAIWIMVIIVLAILGMALYGYMTGAWENINAAN